MVISLILRNIVTSTHTYTHMCTNSLMPLTQSSELCLYESKWLCTSRKNPVHIRKSWKDGDGVSLVHCTYTLLISLFSFMSEAAANLSFSLINPFCQILWRRVLESTLFIGSIKIICSSLAFFSISDSCHFDQTWNVYLFLSNCQCLGILQEGEKWLIIFFQSFSDPFSFTFLAYMSTLCTLFGKGKGTSCSDHWKTVFICYYPIGQSC